MEKIKISEYVSKLRAEENLSIRKFADKHSISFRMAFRYENGEMDDPTINAASKFCATFGVSHNEFASDYFFTDERIKNHFIRRENILSRCVDFWSDKSTTKFIKKYFDEYAPKYDLSDLRLLKVSDIERNIYSIWHEGTCLNKYGELIWLGPILFLLGPSAPVFEQDYSAICNPIHSIALVDSLNLPDNCENYIFFIPNKDCFNFLRDFPYDKKNCKNNVILYFVDRKEVKKELVLFGRNFLKEPKQEQETKSK